MSHKAQVIFCETVRNLHKKHFLNRDVLDVGSLDINGSNKELFYHCDYTGADLIPGKNVDIVSPIHLIQGEAAYDTIISTEMLEHDKHWKKSLLRMYELLKSGGLLLITCAGIGRKEHGTSKEEPAASPATHDWYRNLSVEDIEAILKKDMFETYYIRQKEEDIQFYGIKK